MRSTVTYIEAKKAEIAQKFRAIGEGSVRFVASREEVCEFFAIEIDTLLDEIESRVLEHMPYEAPDQPNQDAVKAFQHLRTGVETE